MQGKTYSNEENKAPDIPACTFGVPQEGIRLSWEITHRCNFNCVHCCVKASPDSPDYFSKEELKSIMKDFKSANVRKIYVTGGEPFLFEHFFYLLELASQHNIELKIATNGSLITPEIAERLKKYNIYSILVSIDSPVPSEHNKFRQHPFAFMLAARAIRTLVQTGIKVKVSTVIWRGNIDKIEDMIQLSIGLGAYKQYFSLVVPVGRANYNKSILSKPKDFRKLQEKLLKLSKKYRGFIEIHARRFDYFDDTAKPCRGATSLYHINNKGYVSPCSWIDKSLPQFISTATIKEKPLLDIIENDPHLQNFREFVRTYTKNYGPGCPIMAKLTFGDFEHSDPLYIGKKTKH